MTSLGKEITYKGGVKVVLYGAPYYRGSLYWIGNTSYIPDWFKGREEAVYQSFDFSTFPDSLKETLKALGLNSGPSVRVWNKIMARDEEIYGKNNERLEWHRAYLV